MANTTWSTTDKTANVTLSGGNLVATSTGSSGGVRAVDRQITGKFYWENTGTTWVNAQTGMGFANATPVLSSVSSATWPNACVVQRSGGIFVNGAAAPGSPTLGTRATGDVIGIAIDADAKLAWFRVSPSGNWNGSGTANPATGAGGVSFSAISPDAHLLPVYPLWAFVGAGDVCTANFGDTAFSGTVPSGFTSGFPTNVPTLVAANTQAALEVWATAGAGTRLALMTQLGLEQWAVLPSAIIAPRQTAVTVN